MKKILVPTDFSESATNAFTYALTLANEINASITLLHVVEVDLEILDLPIPSGAAFKVKKEAAEIAMHAQIELATNQDNGSRDTLTKIETSVVVGNPITLIKSTAKDMDVAMIIMGARGKKRSGLQKLMGTRSCAIAEEAEHPVIIVPEGIPFKNIVQLAYATELSHADSFELWTALELIKPFSPIVRFVHVSLDGSAEEQKKVEKMRKHIEAQNPALQLIFYQLFGKKIDKELEEFIDKFDVDLLVIYHKSKSIWQRLFSRSHTKHLLSMVDVPVLVLKD